MQLSRSYDTTSIIDKNTDTKTESNITSNYKKRREELNRIVKHHIARQRNNVVQKSKALSV
ncbi:MAG: hypothetical protein LN573_06755 [Rickettsia endosymbiont of Oxypoda opaca]|nr:hypothetical protein [Rickettsia endosymbiont of Oxypoda opaca]